METDNKYSDWVNLPSRLIIDGTDSDGNRHLKNFLRDYKKEFSVDTVNASCETCLNDYITEFKRKFKPMSKNTTGYQLLAKRENIRVDYDGQVFHVTNENLNEDLVKILLAKFEDPTQVFAVIPVDGKLEAKKAPAKASKATAPSKDKAVEKTDLKDAKNDVKNAEPLAPAVTTEEATDTPADENELLNADAHVLELEVDQTPVVAPENDMLDEPLAPTTSGEATDLETSDENELLA